MSVKALKLSSSEELIGEVVSETETSITLKNIVSVAVQQTEKGPALGFLPFMPYLPKKAEIAFDKKHIILVNDVDEQMENQYNSVFGGIVKPNKSLILG
jgi:hypothetical protein